MPSSNRLIIPNRRPLWKPSGQQLTLDPAHPLTRGLVQAYLFNERGGSPRSLVNPAHSITLSSGATWSNSIYGPALTFNGTTTGKATLSSGFTPATGHTYSVDMAVRLASSVPSFSFEYLLGQEAAAGTGLFVTNSTGPLVTGWDIDTASSDVQVGSLPSVGVWYHVIFVISGGTSGTIYQNGLSVASGSLADDITYPLGWMGSDGTNATNSFDGDIGWLRIWDQRALTAADAMALYLSPFEMVVAPPEVMTTYAILGGRVASGSGLTVSGAATIALLAAGNTKSAGASIALKAAGLTVSAGASIALKAVGLTQSAAATIALKSVNNTVSAGASIALKATGLTVNAGASIALKAAGLTKAAAATIALSASKTANGAATIALKAVGLSVAAGDSIALKAVGLTVSAGASISLVAAGLTKSATAQVALKAAGLSVAGAATIALTGAGHLTVSGAATIALKALGNTTPAAASLALKATGLTQSGAATLALKQTGLTVAAGAKVALKTAGLSISAGSSLAVKAAGLSAAAAARVALKGTASVSAGASISLVVFNPNPKLPTGVIVLLPGPTGVIVLQSAPTGGIVLLTATGVSGTITFE